MANSFVAKLLGALGLILIPATVRGQQATPVNWLQEIRSDLEKALGYALPGSPRLEKGSLRELPDADVTVHLRWRFPHLSNEAFAAAMADAQVVNNMATLARLLEGTNVILIHPENQKAIATWDKNLTAADSPEFLKLCLIHETVRFALDQRYDLVRRRQACGDAEEWFAFQALVEGRAQQITSKLAARWGMEKTFRLLADRFLHVPDASADPGLRTSSQAALRQRYWAYTHGKQFFSCLEEHGMTDIEKQVFARPPRLVDWIDHPEKYVSSLRTQRSELSAVLNETAALLPLQEWSTVQQAWTPAMVLQAAGAIDAQRSAQKRLEGWQEGRSLVCVHKKKPGCMVCVSQARFQTPAAARSFFNFALDLDRKADEKQSIVPSRCRALKLIGVDEALVMERRVQALVNWTIRARAGDHFLEITWYDMPADLTLAQAAIRIATRK